MKVLVDTNVILDVFLSREPNLVDSGRVFTLISNDEIDAYATASSITDIFYVIAKRLGKQVARETIQLLLVLIGVIAVDGNDCALALEYPISDFEDALIAVCANKAEIAYIVTSDYEFQHAQASNTQIVSPSEFMTIWQRT